MMRKFKDIKQNKVVPLFLFFWAIINIVYFAFNGSYNIRMNKEAQGWAQKNAIILSVVRSEKSYAIRYEYYVNLTKYTNTRGSFIFDGSLRTYFFADKKEGDVIKVFVSQSQPSNSVVFIASEEEIHNYIFTHLLVSLMLVIGGFLFWHDYPRKWKNLPPR